MLALAMLALVVSVVQARTMVTITVALEGTNAPVLPATFRQNLVAQFPDFNETNPGFRWEPPADPARRFVINPNTQSYPVEVVFSTSDTHSHQQLAQMLTRANRQELQGQLGIKINGMKTSDPDKDDISFGVTVVFTLILIAALIIMWLAYLRVDVPNTFFKWLPCLEGTRCCCDTAHAK